MKTAHSPTKQN